MSASSKGGWKEQCANNFRELSVWNVEVDGRLIGTVHAVDEANAGCAALSKFGLDENEWATMSDSQKADAIGHSIPPGAGISVTNVRDIVRPALAAYFAAQGVQ